MEDEVNDPSTKTKRELCDIGVQGVDDFGQALRSLTRSSQFHENMERTAKDFASLDPVLDSSEKILMRMGILVGDLHRQSDRIEKCLEELPNLQTSINACNSVASSIEPSVEKKN